MPWTHPTTIDFVTASCMYLGGNTCVWTLRSSLVYLPSALVLYDCSLQNARLHYRLDGGLSLAFQISDASSAIHFLTQRCFPANYICSHLTLNFARNLRDLS